MIIDIKNVELINSKSIHLHDDCLIEFKFLREDKEIRLSCLRINENCKKKYIITFDQVIGFEMSSCDFWGASPRILDFEYVESEETTLISRLFKEKNDNDYQGTSLKSPSDYIESLITFVSGDRLRIASEKINIDM